MVPKDLSQVKPQKSTVALRWLPSVPCPQQTIGKSRGSHTGREGGTTSPCLSFPTRRWGWRSRHSFCWLHTASWPGYDGPALPAPPQADKAAQEGGTQAPVILNTLYVSPVQGRNLCSRRGRLSLGRGNRTHLLVFSLWSSWVSEYDATAFSLLLEKRAEGIHHCTFPSSTCFMVGVGGPEGSSGRDRWCPM